MNCIIYYLFLLLLLFLCLDLVEFGHQHSSLVVTVVTKDGTTWTNHAKDVAEHKQKRIHYKTKYEPYPIAAFGQLMGSCNLYQRRSSPEPLDGRLLFELITETFHLLICQVIISIICKNTSIFIIYLWTHKINIISWRVSCHCRCCRRGRQRPDLTARWGQPETRTHSIIQQGIKRWGQPETRTHSNIQPGIKRWGQ